MRYSIRFFCCVICLAWLTFPASGQQPEPPPETPKSHDPRIVVELFAASPDIVHPIGLDFDAKGRMLVIESHTHFRPANYNGPAFDRIRMIDVSKKGEKFTTFFEGTKHTMDIAVHPNGSVYLATRNEILRLKDTKGTGRADVKERIAFLDTKGDYPHNGLSGLCFDSQGNLYFGMGENLGASYKMIGSDGVTISGEGDGGHIFWCSADGKKLRKVATGFWNPFGICRDIYGRMFAVDNDPDAMPPCRLLHVVEGGDYGFQFRYGRQGRHPFQAWNGELPGTLPMVSGTGEAPCEILSYESDNLPEEYLGNLLVTSWADHRVERYRLKEKGASFTAEREPFIQGGKDFRPVGMAVAPDGSIFISDWVRRDYNLHGKGAIWHIRAKKPAERQTGVNSRHRSIREVAAREITEDKTNRERDRMIHRLATILRLNLHDDDMVLRPVTAWLNASIDAGETDVNVLEQIATRTAVVGLRALAVNGMVRLGQRPKFAIEEPKLQLAAMPALNTKADLPKLLEFLTSKDPFLRHAATWQLGHASDLLRAVDLTKLPRAQQRQCLLLAHRASAQPDVAKLVPQFLSDPDEEVRFLAAKWVADEKLIEHRDAIVTAMKDPKLNVRMYLAYATALTRIDGQPVNEGKLAEYFFDRLADEKAPSGTRILALQLVPTKNPRLTVAFLEKLVRDDDYALRLEAVRTLGEHTDAQRIRPLLTVAHDAKLPETLRAQAVLGLSARAQDHMDDLMWLLREQSPTVRHEALRTLVGTKLNPEHKKILADHAEKHPDGESLTARVLGKPFFGKRPPANDVDGWLKHLEGPADVAAGRRVFAHPNLAGCFRCHRVEGRGNEVGPDLSTIGRTERRAILESILQPSNNVAPHYQAWQIETADGKVRTGLLTNTHLDDYTYLDQQGGLFKINTRDIVSIQPAKNSIMPDGLADRLTDQEMRDLLAYLSSRR